MDVTLFEKELEAIHQNGLEKRNQSNTVSQILNGMDEELSLYESFIPDFFYKNGNESNIRELYHILREDQKFQESCIDVVDLYESRRIYDDYYGGMSKFVREIISSKSGTVTESKDDIYRINLDKAKAADTGFVKEIFGGKFNQEKSMVMTEAVKNLEFLIDFIPALGDLRKSGSVLKESGSDDLLVKESIGLLCDSVCRYCYESIKTTIKTYGMIDNALNAPIKPSSKTPKFQVW